MLGIARVRRASVDPHGPPSLARRGHAQHHAEPRALISTPLFVIMTVALSSWGLLGSCFRPGSQPFWSSGCMPDTTISPSCTTGNTIAARGPRVRRLLGTTRATPSASSPSTGRELWHQHHDVGPPVRHVPADECASDGLCLVEHDQIVLDEADLQAERDELKNRTPSLATRGVRRCSSAKGVVLRICQNGHLGAGPGTH